MIVLRQGNILWLAAALVLLIGSFGCVDVETDSEPPYPLNPYDYDYPAKDKPVVPWEHPELFPVVTIDEPQNGAFVDPGQTVAVSGTYSGPEIDSITVNGEQVALSGNAFSTTVTIGKSAVYDRIKATAVYEEIQSSDEVTLLVGEPADPTVLVQSGLMADLENRGLTELSQFLSAVLDGLDLSEQTRANLDEKVLWDLKTAVIGNLDVSMRSRDEGLIFDLMASDVIFEIEFFGSDIFLEVDGLLISLMAEISVDSSNQLRLDIVDSNVGLADFDFQWSAMPDEWESILNLAVEVLVNAMGGALIDWYVGGALDYLLSTLDLTIYSDAFNLSILPFSAETTDRNFVLAFDSVLEFTELWNEDFQPEGFYSTASTPPVFDELSPSGNEYGLGLALEDDFLNQVFYALVGSGMLKLEISDPSITAEAMSVLFSSFEGIPADMPVVFTLEPKLGPVFWTHPDMDIVYLTVPQLTGQTFVDRGGDGMWEAMSYVVDVTAPVALNLNPNGTFGLRLGDLDIDWEFAHNAVGQINVPNMDRLFTELFGDVLVELMNDLEDSLIIGPIDLTGLSIEIVDLGPFGPNQDYLGAFVDLTYQ